MKPHTNFLPLSLAQIKDFREQGFLHLKKVIPVNWLEKARHAIDELCFNDSKSNTKECGSNGIEYVTGIGNLVASSQPVFRELLGSPLILSIAESLCGHDFFPIQDFAVIKNLGDDSVIGCHQDVLSDTRSQAIMLGIYLDPANEENGALRVIPGSHLSNESICKLQENPHKCFEMEPGDIFIHDLMLVHSSGKLNSFEKRRVIYYEFMSSQLALEENIYEPEFIACRTSLLPLVMQCYADCNAGEQGFQWKHPDKERLHLPDDINKAIEDIYQTAFRVKPANYCFEFNAAR